MFSLFYLQILLTLLDIFNSLKLYIKNNNNKKYICQLTSNIIYVNKNHYLS